MAATEEVTNSSPLATLGDSLNYQPAILESLLGKKQRLHSFEELKQNINQLLIPLEQIDDELSLSTIDKALTKLTAESGNIRTFIDGVDDELKSGVFGAVDKNLKGLDKDATSAAELVTAAKEAEDDDKEAAEEKALKAFHKSQ